MDRHTHYIDWKLLDRYITGEGTAGEREALRRWAASDPTVEVVAEVMRTAQRLPDTAPMGWDAWRSWGVVAERLGLTRGLDEAAEREPIACSARELVPPPLQLALPGSGRRRLGWRVGIAAAVAVLLAVGWFVRDRLETPAHSLASGEAVGREHVTLRGQRLVVYLPDRTQVILAPESRIRLASDYGQDARIVDLQGQAHFVVTHDPKRPFTVRGDWFVAQDLGTRFVVRAYPGDSIRTVVVAEGLVKLARPRTSARDAGDGVLLQAGDLGRVTSNGGVQRTRGVRVSQYLAWTNGELRFYRLPIRDAVIELGRWYGVDIDLADALLGDEEVTASFKDETAPAAIDAIAQAAGFAVEQRGASFVLYRKLH